MDALQLTHSDSSLSDVQKIVLYQYMVIIQININNKGFIDSPLKLIID